MKELSISESVEESIEYYDESFNEKTLPVLYIRFLAIEKKFQKRGKGTLALKGILKLSRVLAKDFPFRAVVIEALPELEQWYVKMGFARMREEPNNLSLIPMLWDCGVYQSELNEYLVRH